MEWLKITDDGEVELNMEEVKLVPELQPLLTLNYNKQPGDKDGRKKYRLKTELKYLYLMYSPRSPYANFSEAERLAEAKSDCGLHVSWEESKELKDLVPKYFKANQPKAARLLETVRRFIDKFEIHLNRIDLDERNAAGGLIHSPKAVMETLERMPRLAETLQELENQVKSGIIVKTSSKGDHELGWMNKTNKVVTKKKSNDTDEDDT